MSETLQSEPVRQSNAPAESSRESIWRRRMRHPVLAICIVSVLAVAINCYPIIFCGRSFVSPAGSAPPMLHDSVPTFSGLKIPAGSAHGSDNEAPLVWSVPAGFIEARALMEKGELPLWNRYSHAGDAFIGQAVTSFGDPLQFIVILGRGSSIAWDIKYLLAKILFCVGFGLLVLRLLGSLPLSLLFAALGAYCGTYFSIDTHPAFFLFSYAPWILLSAIEFLDLNSGRYFLWGLVWLVANIACFNAGHLEPGVAMIGGLNLIGFIFALVRSCNRAGLAKVVIRMAAATMLFLGLTAPVWMSFLAALDGAYSDHMKVQVIQLPVAGLVGMFDEFLYRLELNRRIFPAIAPATSLLVGVGSLYAILQWRQLKREPFFWINTAAILLWISCAFKVIPAALFEAVPLLNRVGHIYTDFSYLLAISLTIECAYGFKCLAQEKDMVRAMVTLRVVAVILIAMTVVYCVEVLQARIPWNYLLCTGAGALGAPLLFAYLKHRHGRIPALWWGGIIVLGFLPHMRFGLYHTGNPQLLLTPGSRVVLNERSEAIEKIKADSSEPFRVVGLKRNLYGDYAAVYGLEDIRSCAPLSNLGYVELFRSFPGIRTNGAWITWIADPVAARPLLNLLNVKYLLSSLNVTNVPGNGAFPIVDRSDFVVLENKQAWPRAFFSGNVLLIPTRNDFINYLSANPDKPFIALTADQITKEPGLAQFQSTTNTMSVAGTNYKLGVNSTAFDIHATSAGMVCLTEGQAKDFTAMANGVLKPVLTVNRAFKGIFLDRAGDYHIEFTFRPRHWRAACTLFWTTAGLLVILSAVQFVCVRRKQDRSEPGVKIP